MTTRTPREIRSRSGVLVALLPRDPCATHCADDRICDGGFGCPFIPDPAPPSEDEYERFIKAELARGRRDDRELRDLEIMADVRRDKLAEVAD